MRLSKSLAGAALDWSFPGSQGLSALLSGLPWEGRGFVGDYVRLPIKSLGEEFIATVRSAVFGLSGGRAPLRFTAPPPVCADAPRRAAFLDRLAKELDWPARGEDLPVRWAKAALRHFKDHRESSVVALRLAVGDGVSRALEWLGEVFDELRKAWNSEVPGLLWLVIGDMDADFGRQQPHDFTAGLPDPLHLLSPGKPVGQQWREYLHLRIAWETGGRPDLFALSELDDLGPGDDTGLENWLNAQTKAVGARARATVPDDLWMGMVRESLGRSRRSSWREEYRRRHWLWRPPDETADLPVPWLARWWLQERPNCGLRSRLRQAVHCQPLAARLLALCFSLESRWRRVASGIPDSEATDLEGRLQAVDLEGHAVQLPEGLYPPSHPALPLLPKETKTLGKMVQSMNAGRVKDFGHRIREIRNYLAHGHYPNWQVMAELRAIERDFRGLPEC